MNCWWYSMLVIVMVVLCVSACDTKSVAFNRKTGMQLSLGFPEPMRPFCEVVSYNQITREFISEAFRDSYADLHDALYTHINLKRAIEGIDYCKSLISQEESTIRPWLQTRLLVDEAFYHLRQKNITLGIALGQIAYAQSKGLDSLIRTDVRTVLAELMYMDIDYDTSLSLLREAENLLEGHGDQEERFIAIKKLQIRNYNNNEQIDLAMVYLDTLQECCGDRMSCLAEVYRFRGINYHFRNDEHLAQKYLLQSANLYKDIDCRNLYDEVITLYGLAQASKGIEKYDSASVYFDAAFSTYNQSYGPSNLVESDVRNITLLSGKAELLTFLAIANNDTLIGRQAYALFEKVGGLIQLHTKWDKDAHINNQYFHNFFYSYVIQLCSFMYTTTGDEEWLHHMLGYMSRYKSSSLRRDLLLNFYWNEMGGWTDAKMIELVQNDMNLEEIIFEQESESELSIDRIIEKEKLCRERDQFFEKANELHGSGIGELLREDAHIGRAILKNSLKDKIARIYFYTGGAEYSENLIHAISIYNGQLDYYEITGSDEIYSSIDTLLRLNSSLAQEDGPKAGLYSEVSYSIYKMLFSDIYSNVKDASEIHIVPDGKLALLPFEGLVMARDVASSSFKDLKYLIHFFDISYGFLINPVPGASHARYEDLSVLGMAWSDAATILNSNLEGLPELPGAYEEISFLQRMFKYHADSHFFLGSKMTKSNFFKFAASSDIIHLSVHGRGGVSSRLDSRLYFREGDFIDSLFIHDLQYRSITPALTVLSGCETSSGLLGEAEGMFSLARGVYKAGSKTVISNMWALDDQVAKSVFRHFYGSLGGPSSYTHQFSSAKREYLDNCLEENCHPGYWSGLILHY